MSSPSALPIPEGPGSVSGAPNLPAGFTDTFASRYADAGELGLHAAPGGDGPPLLLVHGWPQTWYAWRMLMPALARDFSVVAVDQRGIGLSGIPEGGYDTATLAADLVALMDALGHRRVALYGTGVRMPVASTLPPPRRPPRRGRRPARLRGPRAGYFPPTAIVPPPTAQRAAVASCVQPAPQGERAARHRAGRDLLRRGVRRLCRDEQAAR